MNAQPPKIPVDKFPTSYWWVPLEAEELIAKAYARHRRLALEDVERAHPHAFPPALALKPSELEKLEAPVHYEPAGLRDGLALGIVRVLEQVMHAFFRTKYDHHALCLETVAAVPGYVAAMHRHLRSLRLMQRDHGWIDTLLEEGENERMHLLIWTEKIQPNFAERMFVLFAQAAYLSAYNVLYLVSPSTAHRTVGYLEEAAHAAYTDYLASIDQGLIPNEPAGDIAKAYYRLPDSARLRDVVLLVRADECMHRDFNHHLANIAPRDRPTPMLSDVAVRRRGASARGN